MKTEKLIRLALVIAALHVTVLSFVVGQRHFGYIVAATLSATPIGGVVFFLNDRMGRASFVAGVVFSLAVQQVAYRVWKAE